MHTSPSQTHTHGRSCKCRWQGHKSSQTRTQFYTNTCPRTGQSLSELSALRGQGQLVSVVIRRGLKRLFIYLFTSWFIRSTLQHIISVVLNAKCAHNDLPQREKSAVRHILNMHRGISSERCLELFELTPPPHMPPCAPGLDVLVSGQRLTSLNTRSLITFT